MLLRATSKDSATVQRVLQDGLQYKLQLGDKIWGSAAFSQEEVERFIDSQDLYLYKYLDTVQAVVLLNDQDEQMWGQAGLDDTAYYLHKLCVANNLHGQGVGGRVIQECAEFAMQHGRFKLRLDCPAGNEALCNYYEKQGFYRVRRYTQPSSAGSRDVNKGAYDAMLYEKVIK